MELHNLKPAKGAVKNAKRIGRGEGSKKEVLLQEDIKEQNQDQVTLKKLVLKVDSNLFKEEFQNLVLRIQTELNITL